MKPNQPRTGPQLVGWFIRFTGMWLLVFASSALFISGAKAVGQKNAYAQRRWGRAMYATVTHLSPPESIANFKVRRATLLYRSHGKPQNVPNILVPHSTKVGDKFTLWEEAGGYTFVRGSYGMSTLGVYSKLTNPWPVEAWSFLYPRGFLACYLLCLAYYFGTKPGKVTNGPEEQPLAEGVEPQL